MVSPANKVHQEIKALKDLREILAPQVLQGQEVSLGNKDPRVSLETEVQLEHLAQSVLLVLLDQLELLANLEHLETMDNQERRVQLDRLDNQVLQEIEELKEHWEHLDKPETEDLLVHSDLLDNKELLDNQVLRDRMGRWELQGQWDQLASQAPKATRAQQGREVKLGMWDLQASQEPMDSRALKDCRDLMGSLVPADLLEVLGTVDHKEQMVQLAILEPKAIRAMQVLTVNLVNKGR